MEKIPKQKQILLQRTDSDVFTLEGISENLACNTEIQLSLASLGTLLRDEEWRSHQEVAQVIPHVLRIYCQYPNERFESLRVLINFTADNDPNRSYMTTQLSEVSEFWKTGFQDLQSTSNKDVSFRFVILLTQFIHNVLENQSAEHIAYLTDLGAVTALLRYLHFIEESGEFEEFVLPMEVLAECTARDPKSALIQELEWIIRALQEVVSLDEPEDADEIFQCGSRVLFNVTNVEDLSVNHDLIAQIYALLPLVPETFKNVAHTKRRLFSTCGNISSYPSYKNWEDVERNVRAVVSSDLDPYVVSAAAISLGNCVSSKETQEALISEIEKVTLMDAVVDALLQCKFGDVVHFQALHFFNNTMGVSTVRRILDNHEDLFRITKVVVDNSKYYKEVGYIFLKFVRKLITIGSIQNQCQSPESFEALFNVISAAEENVNEVSMLLLQAFGVWKPQLVIGNEFQLKLFSSLVETADHVEAQSLFEKLKTMAVVFQNYDAAQIKTLYGSDFQSKFTVPFLEFMKQLQQGLEEAPAEHVQQTAAIANNTKFVAASAIKSLQAATPDEVIDQILEICSTVVRSNSKNRR